MRRLGVEWPTIAMLTVCYGVWVGVTAFHEQLGGWIWLPLAAITVTLHSSLQHEALHGHPTRFRALNEALVFPALGLYMPYRRFRDLHLAHHGSALTDPVDDPESNFLTPGDWQDTARPLKWLLTVNNTLAGRLLMGPAILATRFYRGELALLAAGDRAVRAAWGRHVLAAAPVLLWLAWCGIPLWLYLAGAVYPGLSLLTLRTFAEHRAVERPAERTIIIADRGPLSWVFLNNNLHVVHHRYPKVAWYRLPALFAAHRERLLAANGGYYLASYRDLLLAYAFSAKDPVPHPLSPPRHGGYDEG